MISEKSELLYDFPMASRSAAGPRVLYLIAAFKLLKGLVLLAIGFGAHKLLDKDLAAEVYRWANAFRVDPGNYYLHLLLARLSILNEKTLRELSVGTFFYSALLLTEGAGLLLRKHWAEYFTVITTSVFIPLEVYELIRRASLAKGIVLALNVAVVAYLAMNLRRDREQ
jgi:uncharacterized membrane protein (DUF2068 family)